MTRFWIEIYSKGMTKEGPLTCMVHPHRKPQERNKVSPTVKILGPFEAHDYWAALAQALMTES